MGSRVGPDLPTDTQIAHLKRLCAAAGQRYIAPRDRKQARSRIADLQIITGQVQPRQAQPRPQQPQRYRDNGSPLAPLLRKLEIAHYTDAHPREIQRLQQKIDVILEASRPR